MIAILTKMEGVIMLRQSFIVNGHEAVYLSIGVANVLRRMFEINSTKVHARFEYQNNRGCPSKRILPADIVVSEYSHRSITIYGKGALAEMLVNIITDIYGSTDVHIYWFDEDDNGGCYRCREY